MTEIVVSNKVPRRTKRLLDSLIASRQLTKQGLDWLIRATDPFHDFDLKVEGYPDVLSSRCITQEVNLTQNVSVPDGKDLHVFMMPHTPLASASGLQPIIIDNVGVTSPTGSVGGGGIVSGLNAIIADTGAGWFANASTQLSTVGIPSTFASGQNRLICCGWEVVNITPAVFQGGSIVAYKTPSTRQVSFASKPAAGTTNFPVYPVEFGSLPPLTQQQAALYPNSVTWQASDGLYQVAAMNSSDQPYVNPVPGIVGYMNPPNAAQLSGNTPRIALLPDQWQNTTSPAAVAVSSHLMNWDVSGSVISNNTGNIQTYQLTVKYIIERIPTISDQTLLVLAHDAAPYDALALEIYSQAMSRLPVACKVADNPLGEWFESVMDACATALPIIGKAVSPFFGPAALIGDGLGGMASSASKWNRDARRAEEDAIRAAQSAADKARNVSNGQQVRRAPKPLPKRPMKNRSIQTNGSATVSANGAQSVARRH